MSANPIPIATDPRVERVAIAASSYAPHKGGVEELVRQLAGQRAAAGEMPTVITMRWPKSLPGTEVIESVPVRRFLYRVPEGRPSRRALAHLTERLTVRAVERSLRRSGAQLVHIQCVSSGAWFVEQATRRAGLPLVVTMQGELTMDADQIYQRSPFVGATLRHLLETADAVTACSRHTLAEAETWAGIDLGDRGTVVYNGVGVSDFDQAAPAVRTRPYVFAVGRHVRQKGFDVLLEAFARLQTDSGFTWDLVLAGDGPERAGLVAQAARLDLDGRVTFLGATGRRETAELFKGCALFVLPSRHEPFGIVNLEAMAAGRAVVASAVGGVPEFVKDGDTGLLVPAEDSAQLALAIRRIHDDSSLADAFGASGRAVASDFDWGEIDRQYHRVYVQAIERHRQTA